MSLGYGQDHADSRAWIDEDGNVHDAPGDALPDPTPLRPPRAPAAFPVDSLPRWAGEYVTALGTATQTPYDLAACCVLGVLSAAAGGRVVVQPRPGWREPVNLYLLPVLPPGSRKSAVVSDATRPLYLAEQELDAKVRDQMAEAAALKDIATKAADKATRTASNATPEKRDRLTADALSATRAADTITVPTLPRLIADDVTPEAAASLLAEQGGRMAIISAEGGVFDVMAGRYSRGVPVLDVWLKGHAGDPLRVDRKGRPPEFVQHPALTLLLTAQPIVLTSIARNGEFRGRGLLARFLYSIPPDNVGYRQVGADPVSEQIAETYSLNVRKLVDDLAGRTDPAVLTLSEDAQRLLLGLERGIEPKLRRDGDYGAIREWASKLVGATLRFAGLLHLAAGDETLHSPISEDTLGAAIQIAGYFAEHAQAAFGLLGDTGMSDAQYLLEWLHRRQVEEFTIRSLVTDLPRGRFSTAEDVVSTVGVLTEHGWVLPLPMPERSGPGRKPSPRYRTHPAVADYTAPDMTAQSAQSAQPTTTGQFADNADLAAGTADALRTPTQSSADYADIVAVHRSEGGNVIQGRWERPASPRSAARDATLEPGAEPGEVRLRRTADDAS